MRVAMFDGCGQFDRALAVTFSSDRETRANGRLTSERCCDGWANRIRTLQGMQSSRLLYDRSCIKSARLQFKRNLPNPHRFRRSCRYESLPAADMGGESVLSGMVFFAWPAIRIGVEFEVCQ
jgi:hypothetical protein